MWTYLLLLFNFILIFSVTKISYTVIQKRRQKALVKKDTPNYYYIAELERSLFNESYHIRMSQNYCKCDKCNPSRKRPVTPPMVVPPPIQPPSPWSDRYYNDPNWTDDDGRPW